LEKNLSAEKEEIEHKKQEFEKKVTPIMTKIYQGAQGGMPGGVPSGGMPGGFPGGQMPQEKQSNDQSSGPKIEEVD